MRWNRSCAACKRRKIKCNRGQPCGYCAKLGLDCTYLEVAPRSSAVRRDTMSITGEPDDAASRLARVESLLMSLDAKVKEHENQQPAVGNDDYQQPAGSQDRIPSSPSNQDTLYPISETRGIVEQPYAHDTRLIQHERIRTHSDRESCTPEDAPIRGPLHDWLFSQPASSSLQDLHPRKAHIAGLWQVYKDSVDPLLKVLHVPTTESLLLSAVDDLASISFDSQALMFSMYYAAGTSMRYSVSSETLPFTERRQRFAQYEQGMQLALANANIITSPTVPAIQALTIYLTCAQYHGHMAYVWSMTGLLIRLGMKLGLHLEATNPEGSDVATRRRLWGAIMVLDFEIGLVHGGDLLISDHLFDAQLPALLRDTNLSDIADLDSAGHTAESSEMLFTLSRLRIIQCARKCRTSNTHFDSEIPIRFDSHAYNCIEATLAGVEKRCLLDTASVTAIHLFTAIACRAMVARLKRIGLHGWPHPDSKQTAADEPVDTVHQAYKDVQQTLQNSAKYNRWAWILDTDGIPGFVKTGTQAV